MQAMEQRISLNVSTGVRTAIMQIVAEELDVPIARTDPFELRQQSLADDHRAIELLERLARLSNWQKRTINTHAAGGTVTGRGMAFLTSSRA
jgi:hypothetical protein